MNDDKQSEINNEEVNLNSRNSTISPRENDSPQILKRRTFSLEKRAINNNNGKESFSTLRSEKNKNNVNVTTPERFMLSSHRKNLSKKSELLMSNSPIEKVERSPTQLNSSNPFQMKKKKSSNTIISSMSPTKREKSFTIKSRAKESSTSGFTEESSLLSFRLKYGEGCVIDEKKSYECIKMGLLNGCKFSEGLKYCWGADAKVNTFLFIN